MGSGEGYVRCGSGWQGESWQIQAASEGSSEGPIEGRERKRIQTGQGLRGLQARREEKRKEREGQERQERQVTRQRCASTDGRERKRTQTGQGLQGLQARREEKRREEKRREREGQERCGSGWQGESW